MKVIVRNMGGFLIAAVVVALIIALISYTLIPELSQYVRNTFPAEKNLEFVSAVAEDPNPSHEAPADGEVYETADYRYVYNATLAGWSVEVVDNGEVRYGTLFETIYGKPVVDMSSTFKNCAVMTSAPAIPSTVKNLDSTFSGCVGLNGLITVHANPDVYENCFSGTSQSITLIGNSTALSGLAATASAGNVVVK